MIYHNYDKIKVLLTITCQALQETKFCRRRNSSPCYIVVEKSDNEQDKYNGKQGGEKKTNREVFSENQEILTFCFLSVRSFWDSIWLSFPTPHLPTKRIKMVSKLHVSPSRKQELLSSTLSPSSRIFFCTIKNGAGHLFSKSA